MTHGGASVPYSPWPVDSSIAAEVMCWVVGERPRLPLTWMIVDTGCCHSCDPRVALTVRWAEGAERGLYDNCRAGGLFLFLSFFLRPWDGCATQCVSFKSVLSQRRPFDSLSCWHFCWQWTHRFEVGLVYNVCDGSCSICDVWSTFCVWRSAGGEWDDDTPVMSLGSRVVCLGFMCFPIDVPRLVDSPFCLLVVPLLSGSHSLHLKSHVRLLPLALLLFVRASREPVGLSYAIALSVLSAFREHCFPPAIPGGCLRFPRPLIILSGVFFFSSTVLMVFSAPFIICLLSDYFRPLSMWMLLVCTC